MNREERRQQKQAAWSQPTLSSEKPLSPHDERTAALAQLHGTPGWEALKSLLLAVTKFEAVDPCDSQWQVKVTRRQFRSELALELIKAVAAAHERTTAAQESRA